MFKDDEAHSKLAEHSYFPTPLHGRESALRDRACLSWKALEFEGEQRPMNSF